jgi:very-short-patch-repair endonuclease
MRLRRKEKEFDIVKAKELTKQLAEARDQKKYSDYEKVISRIKTIASKPAKAKNKDKFIKVDFTIDKDHPASVGERRIRRFLKVNSIRFCREHQFDDLINPNTGAKLRLDFYLIDMKTCIEFDGQQHYQYAECFDKGDLGALDRRQYLDNIKDLYCASRGIRMIRIPYWQLQNIKHLLKKLLNK